MKTPEGFLRLTEPAIRHFYSAIEEYESIIAGIPPILDYQDEYGEIQMSRAVALEMTSKYEEYFFYNFSKAVLCGSILQIAFMGMKLFSENNRIPPNCRKLGISKDVEITPNNPVVKYCIGREVLGFPIGLIIYAARNQYNHWENGWELHTITRGVFEEINGAYRDNQFFDMAYDLGYPEPEPKSHHIVLNEFRWKQYSDYFKDMESLIIKRGCSNLFKR